MWIIFIILGVVLVWGLCKSGSRFSEPRAEDEETWEEPSGQPGKNSDDELEKIRRQVWEDHKRQEKLRQKQLEKERMAPILEKQAALARQKELEDKYANSPLTREIIQTIRGGSNDLPEEIVVYDDRVTGCTNGVPPGHMTSLQTEWRPSSAYTTACCITETMSFFCARRSLWEMPLIGNWAENTMFRMRRYAEVSSMPILTEKSFSFFTTPPIMFFCG